MIIKVNGSKWDVASVEGNIVTFVDGTTTQVSDATAAAIAKILKPKRKRTRKAK